MPEEIVAQLLNSTVWYLTYHSMSTLERERKGRMVTVGNRLRDEAGPKVIPRYCIRSRMYSFGVVHRSVGTHATEYPLHKRAVIFSGITSSSLLKRFSVVLRKDLFGDSIQVLLHVAPDFFHSGLMNC